MALSIPATICNYCAPYHKPPLIGETKAILQQWVLEACKLLFERIVDHYAVLFSYPREIRKDLKEVVYHS